MIYTALILLVLAGPVVASNNCVVDYTGERNSAAVSEFKRLRPCPAQISVAGTCPGHIVDHIYALCKGGPDDATNMAWQTLQQSRSKNRWELTPSAATHLQTCAITRDCFVADIFRSELLGGRYTSLSDIEIRRLWATGPRRP